MFVSTCLKTKQIKGNDSGSIILLVKDLELNLLGKGDFKGGGIFIDINDVELYYLSGARSVKSNENK